MGTTSSSSTTIAASAHRSDELARDTVHPVVRRHLLLGVAAGLVLVGAAAAGAALLLTRGADSRASRAGVTLSVEAPAGQEVTVGARDSEAGPNPGWVVLPFDAAFDVEAPRASKADPLRLVFDLPQRGATAVFWNARLLGPCEGSPPRLLPCVVGDPTAANRRIVVLAVDASTSVPPALQDETDE
jgi:hypothetical protein